MTSYRGTEKQKDTDKGDMCHADDDGDDNRRNAVVAGEDAHVR